MDFSSKNSVPLRELQDLLIALARPDLYDRESAPLPSDRHELLAILGMLPSELMQLRSGSPPARVLDNVHKPLHLAISGALPNDRVHVVGKGGRAYGFSVENAYAIDETTGRSFFVAATIYANDNEMLNDDRYEYETVASPFMVRLGEVLARALLASSSIH